MVMRREDEEETKQSTSGSSELRQTTRKGDCTLALPFEHTERANYETIGLATTAPTPTRGRARG